MTLTDLEFKAEDVLTALREFGPDPLREAKADRIVNEVNKILREKLEKRRNNLENMKHEEKFHGNLSYKETGHIEGCPRCDLLLMLAADKCL